MAQTPPVVASTRMIGFAVTQPTVALSARKIRLNSTSTSGAPVTTAPPPTSGAAEADPSGEFCTTFLTTLSVEKRLGHGGRSTPLRVVNMAVVQFGYAGRTAHL